MVCQECYEDEYITAIATRHIWRIRVLPLVVPAAPLLHSRCWPTISGVRPPTQTVPVGHLDHSIFGSANCCHFVNRRGATWHTELHASKQVSTACPELRLKPCLYRASRQLYAAICSAKPNNINKAVLETLLNHYHIKI